MIVLTLAVYAPVHGFQFLNYDDNVYVTDNARVASGLSASNLRWAGTAFVAGNWHPVTLVSHMLDVQLFGLNAGAHHDVNLALHLVNVLLVFWLLAGATSQPWPSALVAALFAVHPLNVQTVAWISERKSLVSTAFWLLALLAHVRYRRTGNRSAYLWIVVLAALALAAKPMAVTLPLTLVLFDVWPLRASPPGRGSVVARYARELAPLFALSAACGVLTLVAQRHAQAVQSDVAYPLPVRLANAVVAAKWYLKKMVWPSDLAAFYPHPLTTINAGQVAIAALGLIVLGALVIVKGRSLPALRMGAYWYLVTLLPVVGIIQVGSQAYADRYAYVPLVGIFIAIAWCCLAESVRPDLRRALAVLSLVAIGALAAVTHAQLPAWHDSVSLFTRAVDVVPDNALAHNNLGMALAARNQMGEALVHFEKAVAIAPWDFEAQSNAGNALRAIGRPEEALAAYTKALETSPDDAVTHYNMATALGDLSRGAEALVHLNEAVRLDPGYIKARSLLGTLLIRQGRLSEAAAQFREVVRLDPANARAAEVLRRLEAEPGTAGR